MQFNSVCCAVIFSFIVARITVCFNGSVAQTLNEHTRIPLSRQSSSFDETAWKGEIKTLSHSSHALAKELFSPFYYQYVSKKFTPSPTTATRKARSARSKSINRVVKSLNLCMLLLLLLLKSITSSSNGGNEHSQVTLGQWCITLKIEIHAKSLQWLQSHDLRIWPEFLCSTTFL